MKTHIEQGMYVREIGPAGGSPVVWIHGLGESGLCFEGIVAHPRLAGLRHLVPDLPGYGRSAPQAPPKDFASLADHLVAWLGARREPRVDLVGHSLGGIIVLILAERHPHRVRRLVDVEGNKTAADCVYSRRAMTWSPDDFVRGGFDALRTDIADGADSDPAVLGYTRSLALTDPATFRTHAEELVHLSDREDLARRLHAVEPPAWYIAGGPGGAALRSLALLRSAGVEAIRIEPSGHWPFIDQPDVFAESLASIFGV
ncbi:MAG: alpha/beta hydrolase [Pseudomonadota bacterium]